MKQAWSRYAAKFEALSQRERMMVLVATLCVLAFAGYELVLAGSLRQMARFSAQISKHEAELAQIRSQTMALTRLLAQDPNEELRGRIAALRAQVEQRDREVRNVHRGLVAPNRMAAALEDMLSGSRNVRLVALRTLPVATLVEAPDGENSREAPPDPGRQVYKHGVEMTVQGNYLDLLEYLSRLEKLPWQMFWAQTRMDASDYPRVRLTVKLYTLSLDRAWLVV